MEGIGQRFGTAPFSGKTLVVISGLCVLALPYLLVNGYWIAGYIHMALLEHQGIAGLEGSWWTHATFYGNTAVQLLGVGSWMVVAVIAFGALRVLIWKDRDALPILLLAIVASTAYTVTSVPKVKLAIFGSYIYGLLFAILVIGLATLLRWLRRGIVDYRRSCF